MNLVILTTEFPPGPGGIGTHARELASNLNRMGIQVKVLCPGDYLSRSDIKGFDDSQGFEIARWPYSRFAPYKIFKRIVFTIYKCICWKASCILTSNSRGVLYALVTAKILKLSYIAVGHGAEFTTPKGLRKSLIRFAYNRAEKVVCVSRYTGKIAMEFGVGRQKIEVIYNGADSETFFPESNIASLRNNLGINDKKIILTVGNVSERKAQDIVIRAMPVILEKFPEAVYLVVGWPTRQKEYEELAKRIGVQDRVRFIGAVPAEDLPKYYNLCDVFVLNSRIASDGENEGFGIVLVEAGLCGKPVVGTRDCGIEEVIVDGKTGLLIEPDSPEQTAEAVVKLLKSRDKAKNMGQKGRERALNMFTWKKCSQAFYNMVVSIAK